MVVFGHNEDDGVDGEDGEVTEKTLHTKSKQKFQKKYFQTTIRTTNPLLLLQH